MLLWGEFRTTAGHERLSFFRSNSERSLLGDYLSSPGGYVVMNLDIAKIARWASHQGPNIRRYRIQFADRP